MAKKKSGNKKKRASTQPRQTNLEENTDAIVEETNVNEAEVPQDLPSTDNDNISDSVIMNNSKGAENIITDSNVSANNMENAISADDQQEIPHVEGESEKTEREDFVKNEKKSSDISEIESDVDSSDIKQTEEVVDSVGMDQYASGVDISDAKTEVVDNTDIEEESDLITSDDVDHPDDEGFESNIQKVDELNEEKDVITAIEDIEDHPDDESPIIIQGADDIISEEVASKLETDMDDVERSETENTPELDMVSNLAEEQRIEEEERISEELKRKVEEETRLAEEVLKKAEEENLLAEKARMEKELSLVVQEESRLAEDASISKEKAPQDSSQSENVTLYSLSELMVPKDGVDWAKREIYLKDDEFLLHFEMDKTAFHKLPKWKQVAAKKKVGIF